MINQVQAAAAGAAGFDYLVGGLVEVSFFANLCSTRNAILNTPKTK